MWQRITDSLSTRKLPSMHQRLGELFRELSGCGQVLAATPSCFSRGCDDFPMVLLWQTRQSHGLEAEKWIDTVQPWIIMYHHVSTQLILNFLVILWYYDSLCMISYDTAPLCMNVSFWFRFFKTYQNGSMCADARVLGPLSLCLTFSESCLRIG